MSELGDTFKAMREENQAKRASNLAHSVEALKACGINFKTLSEHHFRIGEFDFWPSTGKWINTRTKRHGRGLVSLLSKIEQHVPSGSQLRKEGE